MRRSLPFLLSLALTFSCAAVIYASDGYTASLNTPVSITGPDSVCKKVTNASATGLSEYIPTASTAEWQSFVAHPPTGVTVTACGETLTVKSATMPGVRANMGCSTAADGRIYCLGGMPTGTTVTGQVFSYNPSMDTVTTSVTTVPYPEGYLSCQMSTYDSRLYCLGGSSGNQATTTIFRYDPSTDLIANAGTLPSTRYLHSCANYPINGKIYCFGGVDIFGTYLASIIEYNPATQAVTTKAGALPTARRSLSCAYSSATSKFYCFGGALNAQNSSAITQIVEYNPATDSVVTKSAVLPSARFSTACSSNPNGKIYCFGGTYFTSVWVGYDDIIEYDPSTNVVTTKTLHLPTPLYAESCAPSPSGSQSMYCLGGRTAASGGFVGQILEYTPWVPLSPRFPRHIHTPGGAPEGGPAV